MVSKYWFPIVLVLFQILFFEKTVAQCHPKVWSFKSGEELYYDVVYNWGIIWVNAGKVKFTANKEMLNDQSVFHFSGTGTSLKKHDWFYKVRDYYNSWANSANLKPIKYTRNTSEGKYKVLNSFKFNHSKKKIYSDSWNSKKKRQKDTIAMPNCTFDIMTAVYYARTIDLDKYAINEKIPITMVVDNEIYYLYGRYLGKETIKTREKKKIDCLKFKMLLVEGTMFKGGEDLFVWISNDANRIPILVEAKILVGSVKAMFKGSKNLKVPINYKPKKK